MKNSHFIGILLCLGFMVSACEKKQSTQFSDPDDFFSQPRFKGNFFKTFSLLEADTIVTHIRSEVPPQWQDFACQRGFYLVQDLNNVTDSMQFRYLDAISKGFPVDSTLVFADVKRGYMFTLLAQYDTALACLKRAYTLSEQCDNPLLTTSVYTELGYLALRQGNYPEATNYYLRSYAYLKTLDEVTDRGRIFDILQRLGHVYYKSQNINESHKWFLKLWDYAMTGSQNKQLYYGAQSAIHLAQSYADREQWDSVQIMLDTLNYFHKTYNNFNREDWKTLLQGKVQLAKGNCPLAFPLFVLAKSLIKDSTNRARVPVYNKSLADGYACAGRLDSAVYWYKVALVTPDSFFQVTILNALSKAYILRGTTNKHTFINNKATSCVIIFLPAKKNRKLDVYMLKTNWKNRKSC